MIIESFLKSALLPALFLNLSLLLTSRVPVQIKIFIQGLLFSGALFVGLWQIKGSFGAWKYGGMEVIPALPFFFMPVILIWIFAAQFLFIGRLLTAFAAAYLIALPLVSAPDVQKFGFAFSFLSVGFWMFSERQLGLGGWHKTYLSLITLLSIFSSFYFISKSSALLAQVFGMFATFQGMSLVFAVLWGQRTFSFLLAAFLVALPILVFLSGMIYL